MYVLVAGGGIAGLTVALTCDQVGIPVRVFESAREMQPLGLGINLQPEAVRELFELGLQDELDELAVETDEFVLVDEHGAEVWTEPRGRAAGSRWPQLSVHRGGLEMLLYGTTIERLGPEAVRTGRRVRGYEHSTDGVRVEVVATDDSTERLDSPVLVGADGLHSDVRSQMFPGDGGPRWGGSVLWRGTTRCGPLRSSGSFVVVGGAARRLTTFPIADPDTGLEVQNWIAEVAFDANRGWRRGDWNTRVPVDEFVDAFDDWRFDWLDVPQLIRDADEVLEYPMVDRDPVGHWVHGSVVLIGDAAHPMYPVGSNGASQAIVDARVLGAAFAEHGVGRAALRAFESALLDARSELTLRNRSLGPASVLGSGDAALGAAFRELATAAPERRDEVIAAYRATSRSAIEVANAAPSTVVDRTA